VDVLLGRLGKPSCLLVSHSDRIAEPPVSGRCTGALHPRMLIGRDCLTSELTTDPTAHFCHDHGTTEISRRQCCRNATAAASNDQHVAGQLHGRLPLRGLRLSLTAVIVS
jgi:hypothetical protein